MPHGSRSDVARSVVPARRTHRAGDCRRIAGRRPARPRFGSPAWDDAAVPRTQGELAFRSGDLDRSRHRRARHSRVCFHRTDEAACGSLLEGLESHRAIPVQRPTRDDEELRQPLGRGSRNIFAFAHGKCAEVAMRRGDLGAERPSAGVPRGRHGPGSAPRGRVVADPRGGLAGVAGDCELPHASTPAET